MSSTFDKNGAQTTVLAAICKQYQDGLFTDLIVKCDDKEHKVHKNVLCATSEWFQKACTGRFIEAKSRMIELHDDDINAVSAMIHFCYHFNYEEPTSTPMIFHVRMFAVGEKYFIPALQSLAVSRLQKSTKDKWDIKDFTVAVKEIYENTSDAERKLRSVVVEASVAHKAELFGVYADDNFVTFAGDLPNYTLDVLRETSKPAKRKNEDEGGPWVYHCFVYGRSCPGRFQVPQRETSGTRTYNCNVCGGGHGLNWNNTQFKTWETHLVR